MHGVSLSLSTAPIKTTTIAQNTTSSLHTERIFRNNAYVVRQFQKELELPQYVDRLSAAGRWGVAAKPT